jgi:hypothetical protein
MHSTLAPLIISTRARVSLPYQVVLRRRPTPVSSHQVVLISIYGENTLLIHWHLASVLTDQLDQKTASSLRGGKSGLRPVAGE